MPKEDSGYIDMVPANTRVDGIKHDTTDSAYYSVIDVHMQGIQVTAGRALPLYLNTNDGTINICRNMQFDDGHVGIAFPVAKVSTVSSFCVQFLLEYYFMSAVKRC